MFKLHQVLLALFSIASFMPSIGYAADCQSFFLDSLKQYSPLGYGVWEQLSDEGKARQKDLIHCNPDGTLQWNDLNTLVHESIHQLDSEMSLRNSDSRAFYLVNGQWLKIKMDVKDFDYQTARGQALKTMSIAERKGFYVKNYLYDLGSEDAFLLMDELNAYTHGLKTSIGLPPSTTITSDRDGVVAFVVFTLRFLEAQQLQEPDYFTNRIVGSSDYLSSVRTLLQQAYDTINESCGVKNLSVDDSIWYDALQTPSSQKFLKQVFGEAPIPIIHSICLEQKQIGPRLDQPVEVNFPNHAINHDTAQSDTTIEIPQNPNFDPKQPSVIFRVTRIDQTHLRLDGEVKGNRITQFIGLNEGETYILWNGKKVSDAEVAEIMKDAEIKKMLENSTFVEVKTN